MILTILTYIALFIVGCFAFTFLAWIVIAIYNLIKLYYGVYRERRLHR